MAVKYMCIFNLDDPCYIQPCLSRKCLQIERDYTNCICLKLEHKKCKGKYIIIIIIITVLFRIKAGRQYLFFEIFRGTYLILM